jgi:hypothetical protein
MLPYYKMTAEQIRKLSPTNLYWSYVVDKKSLRDISKETGLCLSEVCNRLKEYNIKMSYRGQDYFETWLKENDIL